MYGYVVLLLLAIAVGYAVMRLRALEGEIRAEQSAPPSTEVPTPVAKVATAEPEAQDKTLQPINEPQVAPAEESLRMKLLRLIMQQPGIVQTEVYAHFTTEERREIQNLLRDLDQQALLRREKQGNTYALYPQR